MSESEEKCLKYWRALHDVLSHASAALPYGDDPRSMSWSHPDEEWKNDAELAALEEEFWGDTNALIEAFCASHRWPKRSKSGARFFAHRRIEWALRFLRVLSVPRPSTNAAAVPRPVESGWEFLQWLLVDAYGSRNPSPPKSPFYITVLPTDGPPQTSVF